MDLNIGEIVKAGVQAGPLGSLSDAWQALVGDRIAHWRLKNAMSLQVRANEEAQRLGLKINGARIPERYAIAWFEEATKSDEPELQILFARLLARAAAGDKDAVDRRLIDILGRLTPIDAAVFERIYSEKPFPGTGVYDTTASITMPATMDKNLAGWPRDWATALINHFHPASAEKSIEQLIRLGLLESGYHMEGDRNAGTQPSPTSERGKQVSWRKFIQSNAALRPYILPSQLGHSLYAAVKK